MWEFLGGKKLLDKLAMDLQLEYPEITFQAHSPEIIFGTIWKVFLDFYSSQSNRTMWRRKWHRTSYDGPKAMVRQLDFPKLFWSFIENFWISIFFMNRKKATTMIPSSVEYVRQAIGTIGRHVSTHAYAPHVVQSWALKWAPEFLLGPTVLKVMYRQRDGK